MWSFLLASLASLAAITSVHAHPKPHGSHMLNRRAVDLDSFRVKVPTVYRNATDVKTDPSIPSLSRRASAQDVAMGLVQSTVPDATFRLVDDHYVGANGIAHLYFKQTANGLDIDTADFNVNVSSMVSTNNHRKYSLPIKRLLIASRLAVTILCSHLETPSTRALFPHHQT